MQSLNLFMRLQNASYARMLKGFATDVKKLIAIPIMEFIPVLRSHDNVDFRIEYKKVLRQFRSRKFVQVLNAQDLRRTEVGLLKRHVQVLGEYSGRWMKYTNATSPTRKTERPWHNSRYTPRSFLTRYIPANVIGYSITDHANNKQTDNEVKNNLIF